MDLVLLEKHHNTTTGKISKQSGKCAHEANSDNRNDMKVFRMHCTLYASNLLGCESWCNATTGHRSNIASDQSIHEQFTIYRYFGRHLIRARTALYYPL